MPIVVDTKDLAPETAEDFPLPPEPSVTAEGHRGLESGVAEGARVRSKAGIGHDAGNQRGWEEGTKRHNAQDAAVPIGDQLL